MGIKLNKVSKTSIPSYVPEELYGFYGVYIPSYLRIITNDILYRESQYWIDKVEVHSGFIQKYGHNTLMSTNAIRDFIAIAYMKSKGRVVVLPTSRPINGAAVDTSRTSPFYEGDGDTYGRVDRVLVLFEREDDLVSTAECLNCIGNPNKTINYSHYRTTLALPSSNGLIDPDYLKLSSTSHSKHEGVVGYVVSNMYVTKEKRDDLDMAYVISGALKGFKLREKIKEMTDIDATICVSSLVFGVITQGNISDTVLSCIPRNFSKVKLRASSLYIGDLSTSKLFEMFSGISPKLSTNKTVVGIAFPIYASKNHNDYLAIITMLKLTNSFNGVVLYPNSIPEDSDIRNLYQ